MCVYISVCILSKHSIFLYPYSKTLLGHDETKVLKLSTIKWNDEIWIKLLQKFRCPFPKLLFAERSELIVEKNVNTGGTYKLEKDMKDYFPVQETVHGIFVEHKC